MIRAIIIEDEKPSCIELCDALSVVAPRIEVVGTARSVRESITLLRATSYDLLFMDVQLGDGLSFEIFRQVDISAPVIFITAYDSYALKAFENQGIDYLLKPFSHDDLRRALNKLSLLSTAPDQPSIVRFRERFMVTSGDKIRSVTAEEVAYFMADGKYLFLFTHSGSSYLIDSTIATISTQVSTDHFFRINRKFVVSFAAIKDMTRYSGTRIKLTLAPAPPEYTETIVSSDRVADFRKWLDR